jgi:hypothetical protein
MKSSRVTSLVYRLWTQFFFLDFLCLHRQGAGVMYSRSNTNIYTYRMTIAWSSCKSPKPFREHMKMETADTNSMLIWLFARERATEWNRRESCKSYMNRWTFAYVAFSAVTVEMSANSSYCVNITYSVRGNTNRFRNTENLLHHFNVFPEVRVLCERKYIHHWQTPTSWLSRIKCRTAV